MILYLSKLKLSLNFILFYRSYYKTCKSLTLYSFYTIIDDWNIIDSTNMHYKILHMCVNVHKFKKDVFYAFQVFIVILLIRKNSKNFYLVSNANKSLIMIITSHFYYLVQTPFVKVAHRKYLLQKVKVMNATSVNAIIFVFEMAKPIYTPTVRGNSS